MSRASDYVIALRTSASGSSSKAASNSYVTIVQNNILANTNSYIATVNTLAATKASTGKAIAMAMVFG
jgi:hypothetical protein|tara:strand:+ start:680 stop:883 length:204 start_codon:yes stop_codon:yes gene_type:complete